MGRISETTAAMRWPRSALTTASTNPATNEPPTTNFTSPAVSSAASIQMRAPSRSSRPTTPVTITASIDLRPSGSQ